MEERRNEKRESIATKPTTAPPLNARKNQRTYIHAAAGATADYSPTRHSTRTILALTLATCSYKLPTQVYDGSTVLPGTVSSQVLKRQQGRGFEADQTDRKSVV